MILSGHSYGKSRVRLVRIDRQAGRHELKDLTVQIQLEGDFAAAYLDADNRNITATDTMKNAVYALAQGGTGEVEVFGQKLANHFLSTNSAVSHATITLREASWARI